MGCLESRQKQVEGPREEWVGTSESALKYNFCSNIKMFLCIMCLYSNLCIINDSTSVTLFDFPGDLFWSVETIPHQFRERN